MKACFTHAGEANAGFILHPGGNLGVNGFLLNYSAFAPAIGAGITDHAPGAVASGTGTRDAEKSLLIPDLPAASASAASGGSLALRAAGTVALFARLVLPIGDLLFRAERCFFEFYGDIFPQIGAALRTRARARTVSAKQIAKAEKFAKDVAEILKDGSIEPAASHARTHAGMAVAVVHLALFGVRQNGVSLAALLELFFRVRIIRIAVRMVLQCKLAISALDLLISRPTLHTQNFVVISFYARQGSLFSTFRYRRESLSGISRNLYHRRTQQSVL